MGQRYGEMFAAGNIRAEIVARVRAGEWVVDQERLHRDGEVVLEALVAYCVDAGRIRRIHATTG